MTVVACAGLAFAGTAVAQTPTDDAYSGLLGQQQSGDRSDNAGATSIRGAASNGGASSNGSGGSDRGGPVRTSSSDSLPFTGFELGLAALLGAGLLGTGLAARRMTRQASV